MNDLLDKIGHGLSDQEIVERELGAYMSHLSARTAKQLAFNCVIIAVQRDKCPCEPCTRQTELSGE